MNRAGIGRSVQLPGGSRLARYPQRAHRSSEVMKRLCAALESESTVSPLLAMASITVVFIVLFTMLAAELPAAEVIRGFVYDHTQKAMLLVTGLATSASLYYSDVVGFNPANFAGTSESRCTRSSHY